MNKNAFGCTLLVSVSRLVLASLFVVTGAGFSYAVDAPRLVQKDGRYALLIDARPYLVLGGQVHNSSAWPSELPQVWQSMAGLHANTVEAPVYWEQFEAEEGHFDFVNVDPNRGRGPRPQPSRGSPVVWRVEERQHALRAGVGEIGHEAFS
jgi:hypothetical protein